MHKLLEGETSRENLIRELNYLLTKENIPEDNKIVLRDEILIDLNKYYLSAVYAEIISESNYKNEYEIYIKKKEFYLYGRIDKIIFYPNKIKIVDYKTDNLSIGKTKMRTEQYLSQLKFYSYIINQFFANIRKFELQIIFIKNPGIEVRYEVNESDLLMVEEKIVQMTDSLKSGNYSQVKESCKECDYSMNNIRCIKEK
jgi:ATP-dependent exoDNAse (exonuclease V) beta subunit